MRKRCRYPLLLAILLCALVISGCGSKETSTESLNIWVVTEATPSRGMNAQVQYYIDQFQAEHPNVTITLDILPYNEPQRSEYVKELYEKIEAGEGPDIYLLPNQDIVQNLNYWQIEPLFPDVELAMRAGIFADISRNYNFDFKLDKSGLQKTVMDAGVLGGARYVLPLRYEIKAVYYFPELYSGNAELDMDHCTVSDLMQFAIDSGDITIASSVDANPSRAHDALIETFSSLIDYDSGEITLTQQELEEYLSTYQTFAEAYNSSYKIYGSVHLDNVEEIVDYSPLKVSTLIGGIAFSAYAKQAGTTLQMTPLRTDDGDVIATVAYWGAIGSDCKDVETAYEFLRIFLGEEAQWKKAYLDDNELPPLSGYGWPVRAKGSTPYLYSTAQKQMERYDGSRYRSTYKTIELHDQDIPILETDIDFVRFHFCNNFYLYRQMLNGSENGASQTEIEPVALAEAFIQDLLNTYNANLNALPKISQKSS